MNQNGTGPSESKFNFYSLSEFMQRPPKPWLIKHLIGKNDLVMIFGDSETAKTFVTIDMMIAAALGRSVAGKFEVDRPLSIAYCAGEGQEGLSIRFIASVKKFQVEPDKLHIRISDNVPQLYTMDSEQNIKVFVKELSEQIINLDLLVIDTLHSATVGADENFAKDAGFILQAMKHARDVLDCTVMVVHHANRSGFYRGSSALHGAMDTMLQTKKEKNEFYLLECFKQKDAEKFRPLYFQLETTGQSVTPKWFEADLVELNGDQSAPSVARSEITKLLSDTPSLIQTQIVDALKDKVGRNTIISELKEMEINNKVEVKEQGRKKYYELSIMDWENGYIIEDPIV